MRSKIPLLLLISILCLTFTSPTRISTQDCFVQIISVSLDQYSLEIGEQLQVNLVYALYYDPLDPFSIGAIEVIFGIEGDPFPIRLFEFSDLGFNVEKQVIFNISPFDWAPNQTGQLGTVHIEGWVQDSLGTMSDIVEEQFAIQQSNLTFEISQLPTGIIYHDQFNLTGSIKNPHNSSILISDHPLTITATQGNQTILTWNQTTTSFSTFTQLIDTTLLGAGSFDCNIIASASDDYSQTEVFLSILVSSANLTMIATSNTSITEAYYPSMNNCSILISAYLECESISHDIQGAMITCNLVNQTQEMTIVAPNSFSTILQVPSSPGNYVISLMAAAPHHNTAYSTLPLQVAPRVAQFNFQANRTIASYNDFIEFTLSAIDRTSQIAVSNKSCSIYLFSQTDWDLLAQIPLSRDEVGQFIWQAPNLGNEDYRFKAIFQGNPEFLEVETELIIQNSGEVRFFLNSAIEVVRQTTVDLLLQITDLDYTPLPNLSIHLIENLDNASLYTTISNASGYVILTWYIERDYDLGIHEMTVIAQDGFTTIGTIRILIIVYEMTVLNLV